MKKEVKQFPMIALKLTPGQRKALKPFTDQVENGYINEDEDHRFSVLADVRVLSGELKVFLIEADKAAIINHAIMRARKLIKE